MTKEHVRSSTAMSLSRHDDSTNLAVCSFMYEPFSFGVTEQNEACIYSWMKRPVNTSMSVCT